MDSDYPAASPSRTAYRNHDWVVPVLLLVAGSLCLLIDVPVAYFFKMEHQQLPRFLEGPLRELFENCEPFGHGVGAFLIVVAVGVLDPRHRKTLPWILAASWGAGMMANVVKAFVHRIRPRDFDFTAATVWKTFAGSSASGLSAHSFPSAHTATAFGLAVMLGSLFPRGRLYFLVLASLVAAQRIVSSSHFPSDVLAGATIGWIVGTVCSGMVSAPATVRDSGPNI